MPYERAISKQVIFGADYNSVPEFPYLLTASEYSDETRGAHFLYNICAITLERGHLYEIKDLVITRTSDQTHFGDVDFFTKDGVFSWARKYIPVQAYLEVSLLAGMRDGILSRCMTDWPVGNNPQILFGGTEVLTFEEILPLGVVTGDVDVVPSNLMEIVAADAEVGTLFYHNPRYFAHEKTMSRLCSYGVEAALPPVRVTEFASNCDTLFFIPHANPPIYLPDPGQEKLVVPYASGIGTISSSGPGTRPRTSLKVDVSASINLRLVGYDADEYAYIRKERERLRDVIPASQLMGVR